MLHTRTALVAIIALLLPQAPVWAAPPLPPCATSEQVIIVAYVDVEKTTPATLQATAKALLGEQVGPVGPVLLHLAGLREKFVAAGGRALVWLNTVAQGDPDPDRKITLIGLRDGAAPDDMRRFLAALQGAQPTFAVHDADKGWLRLAPNQEPLRPLPRVVAGTGDEHRKALQEALQEAGDAPVAALVVPNATVRRLLPAPRPNEMPPGYPQDGLNLMRQVAAAQWVALSVKPGADPVLKIAAQAPTTEAAKTLAETWKSVLDQCVPYLKNPPPGAFTDPTERPLVTGLAGLRAIPPKQTESRLSLTVAKADLQPIAKAVTAELGLHRDTPHNAAPLDNLKQLAQAVMLYAADHNDTLPDKLDQLKGYVGESWDQVITNPRTGEKPGFVYTKPAATLTNVKDPAETVILHEAKGGKADPEGCRAYADGHVIGPKKAGP